MTLPFAENELRDFLQEANQTAKIAVEPLRAEASSRRYFRLRPNESGETLILAIQEPFATGRNDFLTIARQLEEADVPAPRIVHADPARGWVLQSDAGQHDFADLIESANASANTPGDASGAARERRETVLKSALDLMIQVHALEPAEPVLSRRFDAEKLWWEMEFLLKTMRTLAERSRQPVPMSFELEMFLKDVCDILDHEGKRSGEVFTHRDYHTRNIMNASEAPALSPVLIDFQDARMGLPWYDLASLLWDPYTDFSNDERVFGYEYYRDRTGRGHKRARDMFFAQALQRIFKALGTYLFQVYEKGALVYEPSIEKALTRLEEITQRGFLPDSVYLFVRQFRSDFLPALPPPPSTDDAKPSPGESSR